MGRITDGKSYVVELSNDGRDVRILQAVWVDLGPGVPGYHSMYETRKCDWYRTPTGELMTSEDLFRNGIARREFAGHGWNARGINEGGSDYTPWVGQDPFLTEEGALESAMAEYEE